MTKISPTTHWLNFDKIAKAVIDCRDMKRISARLSVVSFFAFFLSAPAFAQAQGKTLAQEAWQSSWDRFLDMMASLGALPEYSFPRMFPAAKDFVGKTVFWEGTIGDVKDVKTRIRVQMPTSRQLNSASGKMVLADSVQLEMTGAALQKWKQVPKGAKVKFKATVPDLFYIFATLGGAGGTPIIIFTLDKAEPQ